MATDGPIELVSKLVTYSQFDDMKEGDHRDIVVHISTAILPHVPLRGSCPPPAALVYAIRNIMKPELLPGHIPELLEILGHLNILRKQSVKEAKAILTRNQYYLKNPGPTVSILSPTLEDQVCNVLMHAAEEQKVYRSIVNMFYELDIHQSFLHGSPEVFWLKMTTYFPGQFSDVSEDPTMRSVDEVMRMHSFHYDLSAEEQHDSQHTGICCAKFARDAARYMEDPAAYCTQVGAPKHTTIATLFPPPDIPTLVHITDKYLVHVLKLATLLERHFGPN
ncbi:uncharacterized protein C8Q71DRAFT_757856 [Rhodofomes roseus]|uniref:Uncharacterized protein n=1 Tax=Rhodofomes roseus TaxID=34475 RepID=A0ABQ8KI68_9APHY|nr:uncharacterized protein C8Q71DRAFT_757856 [Rhodofomes roseus]KAH9837361.1 hypothetical protein C8Q71DRAFT_757856 [Rhodofomes roseus]